VKHEVGSAKPEELSALRASCFQLRTSFITFAQFENRVIEI